MFEKESHANFLHKKFHHELGHSLFPPPYMNNFQKVDYLFAASKRFTEGKNVYSRDKNLTQLEKQARNQIEETKGDYGKLEEFHAYLVQSYLNSPVELRQKYAGQTAEQICAAIRAEARCTHCST